MNKPDSTSDDYATQVAQQMIKELTDTVDRQKGEIAELTLKQCTCETKHVCHQQQPVELPPAA